MRMPTQRILATIGHRPTIGEHYHNIYRSLFSLFMHILFVEMRNLFIRKQTPNNQLAVGQYFGNKNYIRR